MHFNYFILRCTRISSFIGLLSVSETTFARTLSGYNLAVGLFGRPIDVRRLAVHVRQSFSLITSSVTASFYLILGQSSCINTTSQIWMFCSFFPVMLWKSRRSVIWIAFHWDQTLQRCFQSSGHSFHRFRRSGGNGMSCAFLTINVKAWEIICLRYCCKHR